MFRQHKAVTIGLALAKLAHSSCRNPSVSLIATNPIASIRPILILLLALSSFAGIGTSAGIRAEDHSHPGGLDPASFSTLASELAPSHGHLPAALVEPGALYQPEPIPQPEPQQPGTEEDTDNSTQPAQSENETDEHDPSLEGSDQGHGTEDEADAQASNWLNLIIAIVLVIANGFFVAAEFALVKVRVSRVEQMVAAKRFFSKTALWLAERLERSLSACQLGITMASLALGWVGEPAIAALLEPIFEFLGVTSVTLIHTVSFIIGFTVITALHLVIGEQAPKIFAIRQPESMLLWCALPLKWFYLVTYPLMAALNASTAWILKLVGLKDGEHEVPYTEEEIRALLREAHIHGNLTRSEHRLLDAVFEFDDLVCRRIMLPRGEIEIVDVNQPIADSIEQIRRTKHTRYPVCDGSLDEVLGVLHVKDLIGRPIDNGFEFQSIMRPPKKVPESMQISKLLRHFQATHQLMAFVLDEHGTVIGIVTLENVLEEIIGNVADEFDIEDPRIVPAGPDTFDIDGSTSVAEVEQQLGLFFGETEADTMAGLLMHFAQRIVVEGDVVDLGICEARVLQVADDRTTRLKLILPSESDSSVTDVES